MDSEKQIVNWLIQNLNKRNASGFLIDYSRPSVPAALAMMLANETRRACQSVVIYDKFDSNDVRPNGIAELYSKQYQVTKIADDHERVEVLSRQAANNNLLIIHPMDVCERLYIRPWKHHTLAVDLIPFGNMFKQDIEEMFLKLTGLELEEHQKIMLKKPNNTDLYSEEIPFSYDDLKWAHEANLRYNNILVGDQDPTKNPRWFSLTVSQKKIIAKLHQHAKLSSHKMTNNHELQTFI